MFIEESIFSVKKIAIGFWSNSYLYWCSESSQGMHWEGKPLENGPGLCCVKIDKSMRILQVSTADKAGGAEAVAWQLFQAYRSRGHHSLLAVGLK